MKIFGIVSVIVACIGAAIFGIYKWVMPMMKIKKDKYGDMGDIEVPTNQNDILSTGPMSPNHSKNQSSSNYNSNHS